MNWEDKEIVVCCKTRNRVGISLSTHSADLYYVSNDNNCLPVLQGFAIAPLNSRRPQTRSNCQRILELGQKKDPKKVILLFMTRLSKKKKTCLSTEREQLKKGGVQHIINRSIYWSIDRSGCDRMVWHVSKGEPINIGSPRIQIWSCSCWKGQS